MAVLLIEKVPIQSFNMMDVGRFGQAQRAAVTTMMFITSPSLRMAVKENFTPFRPFRLK